MTDERRAARSKPVERLDALLDALVGVGVDGLGEVFAAADIPRATGYRMAAALEDAGLIERSDSKRVVLGLEAQRLGLSAFGYGALHPVVDPILAHLRDVAGRVASLGFIDRAGVGLRIGPTFYRAKQAPPPHRLRLAPPSQSAARRAAPTTPLVATSEGGAALYSTDKLHFLGAPLPATAARDDAEWRAWALLLLNGADDAQSTYGEALVDAVAEFAGALRMTPGRAA